MFPVDPNEFGKGEVSLRALVFFFSVSEPGASAEAIVGIGSRITAKFSKKESFLLQTEGTPEVYPDLEVMGRGFDNHASGFEGTIGPFMMGPKQRARQVIGQQIGFRVLGLNEDMSSLGVLCLEVRDESGFGLNDPAAFFKVEDRHEPVGLKIPVECLKDFDHDFLIIWIRFWVVNRGKNGYRGGGNCHPGPCVAVFFTINGTGVRTI